MTCISEGCVGLLCVVFRRRLALRVQVMEVDVSACVGDTAERFIGSCGWVTLHKEEVMRRLNSGLLLSLSAAHCV